MAFSPSFSLSHSTLSAPDSGVRKIMLKASLGQPLNDRELKRLAARQRAEEQTVGTGGKISGGVGITTPSQPQTQQTRQRTPAEQKDYAVTRATGEMRAMGGAPREQKVAAAKQSGSFNLLRDNFNQGNSGKLVMDENGNISPATAAPQSAAQPATPTAAQPAAPGNLGTTVAGLTPAFKPAAPLPTSKEPASMSYQRPDGTTATTRDLPGTERKPTPQPTIDGARVPTRTQPAPAVTPAPRPMSAAAPKAPDRLPEQLRHARAASAAMGDKPARPSRRPASRPLFTS
jgi:hypothetical protein